MISLPAAASSSCAADNMTGLPRIAATLPRATAVGSFADTLLDTQLSPLTESVPFALLTVTSIEPRDEKSEASEEPNESGSDPLVGDISGAMVFNMLARVPSAVELPYPHLILDHSLAQTSPAMSISTPQRSDLAMTEAPLLRYDAELSQEHVPLLRTTLAGTAHLGEEVALPADGLLSMKSGMPRLLGAVPSPRHEFAVSAGDLALLAQEGSLVEGEGFAPLSLVPGLERTQSSSDLLPEWTSVKLPSMGKSNQWGDALRAALGEQLNVQIGHGIDRARIRLDPPSLGSLEILIRHEAGALSIQLVASHTDLVRQLHSISDALRQDLSARQFIQVAVDVRTAMPESGQQEPAGNGHQQQHSRNKEQHAARPGRALDEIDNDMAKGFTLELS